MHALGPVGRTEAARLRAIEPGSVVRHRELKILMTRVVPHAPGGQTCTFLDGDAGCRVYACRPVTCRMFPFGLVATPHGLRVTTEHRCPCRSLGDRPPLDEDHARAALTTAAGRLRTDHRVGDTVPLAPRRRVSFARFVAEHETPQLATLLAGPASPSKALGVEPFASLDGVSWVDVAHLLRAHASETTGDQAVATFGDALLRLYGQATRARRERPWSWAFDRAEQRGEPSTAGRVLGDWAADVLWALGWTDHGDWHLARLELASRLAVAEAVTEQLADNGMREDRAAAEAVMMAEIVGALPLWASLRKSLHDGRKLSGTSG